MNTQNLQNLIGANRLEYFKASMRQVEIKYGQAVRRFRLALQCLEYNADNQNNDLIYSDMYDAARWACEALLWLYGYRVKQRDGYHALTLEVAGLILENELSSEFKRIKKMRQKRNDIQYDVLDISSMELERIRQDVATFLKTVRRHIIQYKQQGELDVSCR